jgi:hypothetical protein
MVFPSVVRRSAARLVVVVERLLLAYSNGMDALYLNGIESARVEMRINHSIKRASIPLE